MWLRNGRWKDAQAPSVIRILSVPHGRPRRLDNRNSIALNNHEQPLVGESLLASTEQPVYRLEPSPEERGPRERWSPFFNGKEGDGG